MIALLIGLVLVLFSVFSVLPFAWGLQWWSPMVEFLKGAVPILAVFIGLIALFVGIADIKDKIDAKKEEKTEEKKEEGKPTT